MPTYRYECAACGHSLEEFQSMTAKPLRKCPQCQKPKLQRLIGPGAGILFKGDGFYSTDYRSDSWREAEKAASGDAPGESKPGESKPADASTGSSATPAAPAPAKPGKSTKGSRKDGV